MSAVMTPDEIKARNRRNVILALSIGAFVVLVFLITMSRIQGAPQ